MPFLNIDHPGGGFNQLPDEDVLSLDTRRLQAQHTTEGYRDGITLGKAESIQTGFDEGFSLGGNIGLKAGRILGILEGLAAAFREGVFPNPAHVDQLLSQAKTELSIGSIYAEQYWAADGSWKYPVKGSEGDGEMVFEDVASQHPVIMKWEGIVSLEAKRWNLGEKITLLDDEVSSH
ncbi:hypothetical protein F4819DRAFT_277849 [Hypoxylon fuscum]|nr:hypothetical protein F4819DRAFT_277849 [Hypoxylon fuscum]